jgi:hypothetical protein
MDNKKLQTFHPREISQEEFENSVRSLKNTIRKVYKNKKIPSMKDQLSDLV